MSIAAKNLRTRELAAIHVGKKALFMDDWRYRRLLWEVARVHSAAELDGAGRRAVIERMRELGFQQHARSAPGRGPHNIESLERGPQLRKISALLANAGRTWAYADKLAKRMHRVERVSWCDVEQLRGVIAALVVDAKRHGRRA